MQIFVLGMHRSGTSMVAGLLNMMGAYFGPEDQDMGMKPDNPKGFWERRDVMEMNDAVLAILDATWSRLNGFDINRIPNDRLTQIRAQIGAFIHRMDAHRPWMLKDPRLCLLFPLWREQLELPVCIHVYRNPIQIAQSLKRRNGFPVNFGIALWERYLVESINATRKLPNILVLHQDLISDPVSTTRKLFRQLTELDVDGLRPPQEREILSYIDRELFHERDADSMMDLFLNPKQLSLIDSLTRGNLLDDESQLEISDSSQLLIEQFERFELHALELEKKNAEIRRLQSVIEVLHIDKEKLNQSREDNQKNLDDAERCLRQVRETYKDALDKEEEGIAEKLLIIEDALEQEKSLTYSLRADLDITRSEKNELARNLAKHDGTAQSLKSQLTAATTDQHKLSECLDKLQEHNMQLRHWLAALNEDLEAIFQSWRWKVGHTTISIVERLLLRGRPLLSKDHVDEILQQFRKHSSLVEGRNLYSGQNLPAPTASTDIKAEFTALKKKELEDFLASNEMLSIPDSSSPTVSIILVLYNRAELTFTCLQSIAATLGTTLEVIIIDNASTDRTQSLLQRLNGVRIIRNKDNLGFLKACNQAAKIAKGRYLLFLNNDAQLLSGSLESAIRAHESSTDIGAVGGKILFLDGHLQEAGSIIWRDGWCLGYGRNDSPYKPEYMFRREVDYCSGAFLLTAREIFNDLGGFDESFVPAYYEETDYCLRLWEAGRRVIYEPNAMIMHYEFASSSSDDKAIELQKRNQKTFLHKHKARLAQHLPPDQKNILKARFAGGSGTRVLYLDDRVPHKNFGSGFPRANQIVRCLVDMGYQVTIYPLNFPVEDQWDTAYSDIPLEVEIMLGFGRSRFGEFIESRAGYYDLMFISRPHNMKFFQYALNNRLELLGESRIIYDSEAIFSLREKAKRELSVKPMSDKELRREMTKELSVAEIADLIFVVSPDEKKAFEAQGYDKVHILGHALQPKPTAKDFSERKDILFVGNLDYDSSPNADSLIWFVREVLPIITSDLGSDVRLLVIGSNHSKKVKALHSKQVQLLGRVVDISQYYNDARIFVAPTRFAAGIPHKLHEAAAEGIPAVATSLLVTQLGWKGGKELLQANPDDPQLFARRCINLYRDRELWNTIRLNALERVTADCSEEAFVRCLKQSLLCPIVESSMSRRSKAKRFLN